VGFRLGPGTVLARRRWQGHRATLAYRLDGAQPLLAQNALHATDGVALAVEQMTNAAQQVDVFRTIVTPAAAALHRPDLGEAALPKPQHSLRQIEFVRDLADRTKGVRRFVQSRLSVGSARCYPS